MGEEQSNRFTLLNKLDIKDLSVIEFKEPITPDLSQKLRDKYKVLLSNLVYVNENFFYTDLIFQINNYYLYLTRDINESYFMGKIFYPENKIEEIKLFIKNFFKDEKNNQRRVG
jgi:hypothetical protein